MDQVPALGVNWHLPEDSLSLKSGKLFQGQDKKLTKRTLCSHVASVFDPLQLSAPYLVVAKRLLQSTWQIHSEEVAVAKAQGAAPEAILKLRRHQWDTPLPDDIAVGFTEWALQLPDLLHLQVPRCVVAKDDKVATRQLHVFSDASPFAFAAAVYVRATYESGAVSSHLLAAKSRVAPSDVCGNMPRLELLGTLIATRLAKHIISSLRSKDNIDEIPVHFWTDSSVALQWIQGGPGKWQPWVSNRVRQIIKAFPDSNWHHVPGTDNPSDLATRGITAKACASSSLWLKGPAWLLQDQQEWPDRKFTLSPDEAEALDKEARPRHRHQQAEETLIACNGIVDIESDAERNSILLDMTPRCSSLQRLITTAALIKYKRRGEGIPEVSYNERTEVLFDFIRAVQSKCFFEAYTTLAQGKKYNKKWPYQGLEVFLDPKRCLRAKGRWPDNMTTKEPPLLLPHDHHLTALIVLDMHHRYQHSRPGWLISFFRQRFWMAKALRTIKSVVRRCTICTRFKGQTIDQVMGPLPQFRVDEEPRPFSITACDYARPLEAYDGEQPHKVWILIFACMQVRCVHLELVTSMDTETLLSALRRFMARRGRPRAFYSDQGRSFRLAAKEIESLNKIVEHEKVPPQLRAEGIQWLFSVPSSPWRNGPVERMVRATKTCLRAAMFRERLTQDQIHTYLCEAEGILNSRPMAAVTDDPSEPLPVSPGMLLQGYETTAEPYPDDVVALDHASVKSKWNKRLHLQKVLLRRFIKDYIQALRPRQKWHEEKDSLKVGDLVFVEEAGKRLTWPLAKVIELHPGKDGIVRSVSLRTKFGVKKRPVQRLVPLEISAPNDIGQIDNLQDTE